MTATGITTTSPTPPEGPFLHRLGAFAASFRWAMEVQRRFERASAQGSRLDGDAIRRIAGEADAWLESR